MDFSMNRYQETATSFALYKNPLYPFLELAGEAGEVLSKVAKHMRGDYGQAGTTNPVDAIQINGDMREAVGKELGDLLWMIANAASEIDMTLNEVAMINIDKLTDRKAQGKIKGEGDNR